MFQSDLTVSVDESCISGLHGNNFQQISVKSPQFPSLKGAHQVRPGCFHIHKVSHYKRILQDVTVKADFCCGVQQCLSGNSTHPTLWYVPEPPTNIYKCSLATLGSLPLSTFQKGKSSSRITLQNVQKQSSLTRRCRRRSRDRPNLHQVKFLIFKGPLLPLFLL